MIGLLFYIEIILYILIKLLTNQHLPRFGPYFVEPVIAGLDPKTFEPYVCNMDLIGCINEPEDFVVAGSCTEQLYGMCEALWEPNLKPDDLFETCAQALVNAFDRDAMSGWGAIVHIMYVTFLLRVNQNYLHFLCHFSEKDKITSRKVKTRMD